MIFDFFGTERLALKQKVEVLTQALIDSDHWGQEANKRLAQWVAKHDDLLAKYKQSKQMWNDMRRDATIAADEL